MIWCVNGIKLSLLLLKPSCFFWGLNLSLRFSFVFKHFYYETLFFFFPMRHLKRTGTSREFTLNIHISPKFYH